MGTLYPSGKKFDSSRDRGTPFSFELGKGQVIAGWEQSMGTMKEGELMIVIIHPDLGKEKSTFYILNIFFFFSLLLIRIIY